MFSTFSGLTTSCFLLLACSLVTTEAFFLPCRSVSSSITSSSNSKTWLLMAGYVPEGLTPEQYQKIKQQDARKKGQNLGRLGPRGFTSRSLQGWQEAMEKGQAGHAMAPVGYRELIQQGKMTWADVPYMVRPGGSWDQTDVAARKAAQGGKWLGRLWQPKVQWSETDKKYARGGYKKEQSASILGSGPGLDWTGKGRLLPSSGEGRHSYPGWN